MAGGRDGAVERRVKRALEQLHDAGAQIIEGVERCLPRWTEERVARVLDDWGRADNETRTRALAEAHDAGAAITAEIVDALRALLATDPGAQRATPLEIVRRAVIAPTRVLQAAGVPEVLRDPFDERSFPDDLYDLTPRTLGDLGDDRLAALHFVWGMAKAKLLRSRAERSE